MNKNLDHLFEQARKSMQSEMPLEEVQQLIHGQASPSLWTKKNWIMSTSIIGIITIGILCWFNNYQQPTQTATTTLDKTSTVLTKKENSEHKTIVLEDAAPDNIPLPILDQKNLVSNPIIPASLNHNPEQILPLKKATSLDSLIPKKTFTEYKLEIKKENSEQEIKKLKSELSNYGIHMDVKILSYDNDNKIKRFKGQFKTDSLFCGSTMNDYEFDISGSFKSMEFIFRVADDKNLKYLKIQSDNFEETIECYDDEVISSTQEARKLGREIQEEMALNQQKMANAQMEMANAQMEMANAQQEIAKAKREVAQLKRREFFSEDSDGLERLSDVNWDKIETDIEKAMESVEVELENVNEDIMEALENMDVIILDKNFKEDMKILKKDLAKMRLDIELEIRNNLKTPRIIQGKVKRYEFPEKEVIIKGNGRRFFHEEEEEEGDVFRLKHQTNESRLFLDDRERSAEELKEEATSMEEAAKELKREAKEKRKMARKKAKNK